MLVDYLRTLSSLDRSSPQFPDVLCRVLNESDFDEYTKDLGPDPLLKLIEYLDEALDGLDPTRVTFRRALRKLQAICVSRRVLPPSHVLLDNQLNIADEPFASGGYSDVYKGALSGSKVCVKELRVASTSTSEKTRKMLYREAVMWKRLTHANIVPFKGVTFSPLRIVSEWMPGGDLTGYICRSPQADRIGLLVGVAKGLGYLHLCDVVHGDLKGPNILVDDSGCARIADFGLARNQEITYQTTMSYGQTARWTAPEILDGDGVASKEADVFAFAMVMVEAFTGAVPFHLQPSVATMLDIMEGKRPPRPEHPAFSPDLWILMERCWNQEPSSRPDISEVLRALISSDSSSERDPTTGQLPIFGPPFDPLRRIQALPKSSPHFPQQLAGVFENKEFRNSVQYLQGERLAMLVNELDSLLDTLDPASLAFPKCQRELRRICGAFEVLPDSCMVSNTLLHASTQPVSSTGLSGVYKGTLNGSSVCVKRARIHSIDSPQGVKKLFYQEAIMWKHLTHPNIVPFRGVTVDPLQLISDWMPGGDLANYISQHRDVDRLILLEDIAKGLHYLHSRNVVHGDLRASTIFLDATGHARITDFGFATVSRNRDSVWSISDGPSNATRWTAPEISSENRTQSKAADVFSFAMVMIEVFTGAVPFNDIRETGAAAAVLEGKRPSRPTHNTFTDNLWMLTNRCWDQEPKLRPEMTEVLQILFSSNVSKKPAMTHAARTGLLYSPPGHLEQLNGGPLDQLRQLRRSSPKFPDRVSNILYGEEYQQWVGGILEKDVVQELVDWLDGALDILDPASSAARKCMRELRHICGARKTLPTSSALSSQVLLISNQPVASGGSGDVYEGSLNNLRVCVKRVRVYARDSSGEPPDTFFKEAVVWKRLKHKNIVPLICVSVTPFQLISEWMPGGDLTEYVGKHPEADRLSLLCDVAEGLLFLHSRNMVHGDLKGPNILVDGNHCAQLTDFGLATVTQNLDSIRSTSEHGGHTARWTAPEILNDVGTYSKEADVFSFAMVMIEAFTGAVPFSRSLPAAAMLAIMGGKRPPKPTHPTFTPRLWMLMQRCWDQDPLLRPEVSEIWRVLSGTEPPPLEPHFYGIGSASTLTVGLGHQPVAPPFPKPGARQPPSLQNTSSTASRITPQVSSQRSGHSSGPAPPVSYGAGTVMHENQRTKPYGGSQAMLLEPVPGPNYDHPGGQLGGRSNQQVGPVGRRPSRRDTATSEPPTPLRPDPSSFDPNRSWGGQPTQVYRQMSGAAKSRTSFKGAPDDRHRSRKDVNATGEGYNRGGSSRNPSQADLLANTPQDHTGYHGRSTTTLNNLGKGGSRPGLLNPGDGAISRRTSKRETQKREPSIMNGQAGNRSRHNLVPGTEPHSQSRLDIGDIPPGNEGRLPPQTPNGSPSEQENHAGKSRRNHEQAASVLQKKHGLWCRLRRALGFGKKEH